MFDKLKFNNLIISGRKEIQRAKVQVVRKVIQNIQKLKKILERRPDDENCKIKLRKCMAVVESAKKLKYFDVITSVLLLEKSPNKVITNSRSTPEQVSVAMLANNTIIKALSARISKELNFSEADWRKTIIEVSKQKIKKQRKKKRKQMMEAETPSIKKSKKTKNIKSKILPSNAGKVSEKNSEEIVPEEIIDKNVIGITPKAPKSKQMVEAETSFIKKAKKTKSIKSDILTSNAGQVSEKYSEEVASNKIIDNVVCNKPKASKESLRTLKSNVDKKTEEGNTNFEDTELNADTFFNAGSKSKRPKPTKNDKAKNFDNYNIEPIDSKEHMFFPEKKTTFVKKEVKLARVVDPFFITATGESYVTIVPVIETNKTAENKLDVKSTITDQVQNSWETKQNQRRKIGFQDKRKKNCDTVGNKEAKYQAAADLHPSWAAKQKLKPIITTFQGKKIKFEED